MEWFIIVGAVLLVLIVKFLFGSWAHPASVLVRQGMAMGWTNAGDIDESDGSKSRRLRRNELEAKVTYNPARVVLLVPPLEDQPFQDFVAAENWLGKAAAVWAIQQAGGPLPKPKPQGDRGFVALTPEGKPKYPALTAFGKDLETWPRDQRDIGLKVLDKLVNGRPESFEELMGHITYGNYKKIAPVIEEFMKSIEQESKGKGSDPVK